MASHSIIMGTINGVSRSDFRQLEPTLKDAFDTVGWKEGEIIIRSERFHDRVKDVFGQIADRIGKNGFGTLLYVGNNRVACIYFGPGKFAAKEYREPIPPDWWGVEETGG